MVTKWLDEVSNPQLLDPRIENLCNNLLLKISNPLEKSKDLHDCIEFIKKQVANIEWVQNALERKQDYMKLADGLCKGNIDCLDRENSFIIDHILSDNIKDFQKDYEKSEKEYRDIIQRLKGRSKETKIRFKPTDKFFRILEEENATTILPYIFVKASGYSDTPLNSLYLRYLNRKKRALTE